MYNIHYSAANETFYLDFFGTQVSINLVSSNPNKTLNLNSLLLKMKTHGKDISFRIRAPFPQFGDEEIKVEEIVFWDTYFEDVRYVIPGKQYLF